MESEALALGFAGVAVEADRTYDSSIWNVDLALRPGELALVKLERDQVRLPLADAAVGLVEPDHGAVTALGQDWAALPPARAAALRGRIGRVFYEHGWVADLDVEENLLLAQRHHTRRADAELAREAGTLAQMFGLPGLPRGRPSQVRRPDLQRAALARALLGRPELLILEAPTTGVYPEVMPALINALRAARGRGAAVLWTTADARVWNDRGVRPTRRYMMAGSQMLAVTDGGGGGGAPPTPNDREP